MDERQLVVAGLKKLVEGTGARQVRTRYDLGEGATFDVTFNNPDTPFNSNNWVGADYVAEQRIIRMMTQGELKALPNEFTEAISARLPGSSYQNRAGTYEWRNVPREQLSNFR